MKNYIYNILTISMLLVIVCSILWLFNILVIEEARSERRILEIVERELSGDFSDPWTREER